MVCPIPKSGRLGVVGFDGLDIFPRMRNWRVNINTNPNLRVYTGTRFGTQRSSGVVRVTGSFEGFGGNPPLFVGDSFIFYGFASPHDGVPCNIGCALTGAAIVSSLTINWDWTAANRGISWSANFVSNGIFTDDNFEHNCEDEVFCDPGCPPTPIFLDPCNADAVVEFCNLVTASLTFTSNVIEYSNSSTLCGVRNLPGTLDWNLDILDQNPCIFLNLEKDYRITLPVDSIDAAKNWSLKWGRFQDVNNWQVNMETGEIISKNNVFGMQAVLCCPVVYPAEEVPVRGEIKNPSGEIVWPYSIE